MSDDLPAPTPRRARRFRVTTLGLMTFVAWVAVTIVYPLALNRPASRSEAILAAIRWTLANQPGIACEGSEIHVQDGGSGKIWWVTIVSRATGREVVTTVWSPSNVHGWVQAVETRVSFPGTQFRLDGVSPARWSETPLAPASTRAKLN